MTVYKPLDSFKRWGGQNDYTITKGGLLRIQNVILQILDGPLILIPSFNAIGVRGIPMKRILWKGRMVEICVQFAVIFGPFLQAGSDCVQYRLYNDSSQIVSRTWSNFDKVQHVLHLQEAHLLFKSTQCTVHSAVQANTKKLDYFFFTWHQFFSNIILGTYDMHT